MTMESGGLVYPGDRGLSVTKDPGDPFTSLLPPTHLHIGLPTDQVRLVTIIQRVMTTDAGPRPDPDTPPGDEYKTTGKQSELRQRPI